MLVWKEAAQVLQLKLCRLSDVDNPCFPRQGNLDDATAKTQAVAGLQPGALVNNQEAEHVRVLGLCSWELRCNN